MVHSAMTVLDLTTLINDYDKTMIELKAQLKEQKKMVKDAFEGDQEYHELSEKSKELTRQKNAIKQRIMKTPAVETVMVKVKDLQAELKDMEDKLSGYLQEYQRVAGTNVIEAPDGELRQIVPVYRLVKKSKNNP
jgi:seryl-tRNA synthetase